MQISWSICAYGRRMTRFMRIYKPASSNILTNSIIILDFSASNAQQCATKKSWLLFIENVYAIMRMHSVYCVFDDRTDDMRLYFEFSGEETKNGSSFTMELEIFPLFRLFFGVAQS